VVKWNGIMTEWETKYWIFCTLHVPETVTLILTLPPCFKDASRIYRGTQKVV